MKRQKARRYHKARGATLIWSLVILGILGMVASLALDWGRVIFVRSQMQGAADAAARAAAAVLTPGSNSSSTLTLASNRARDAVTANGMIAVQNLDEAVVVEFGRWDVPQSGFNLLSGAARIDADTVRVRIHHNSALMLANFVGRESFAQTTSATAQMVPGLPPFGVVGIDSVSMGSAAVVIDSYDPNAGPYSSGSARANAVVASNGSWNLHKHARIMGDLFYRGTSPTGGNVSGGRFAMNQPLNYPTPTVPAGAIAMGHHSGNQNLHLSAGDYHFESLTLNGNRSLTTTGKVRLFITSSITLNGAVTLGGDRPENLEIHIVSGSANLSFSGNAQIYATIYAPNSNVSLTGTTDLYGRVVAKSISLNGNAAIHCDESLASASSQGGGVRLME